LAALTPRPRINLIFYHGALAPHGGWRAAGASYGVAAAVAPVLAAGLCAAPGESAVLNGTGVPGERGAAVRAPRRGWTWAQLRQRAFDVGAMLSPRLPAVSRLVGAMVRLRRARKLSR
jgi:hypothetical protein